MVERLEVGASNPGTEETRLGTLLLETGIVRETDLQHCLEVQALTGSRWPLGQILVEQGVLTQALLDDLLAVQQVLRDPVPVEIGESPGDVVDGLLERATAIGITDLFLSEGQPPTARMAGEIVPLTGEPLAGPELWAFVRRHMGMDVLERIAEHSSVTMSLSAECGARGRITAFRHFHGLAISVRLHPAAIRPPDDSDLGPAVLEIMRTGRGLVLLAGEASSGVTETFATLLAAAVSVPDRSVLVLDETFEYPVPEGPALITRRRVGQHTRDWASGVRAALREEPDVVFVGHVDASSFDLVVHAAESGALVVACLHAASTVAAISRVIEFHPRHDRARVRSALASALQAVLAVRTVPDSTRSGMVLATELLLLEDASRDLVRTGSLRRIDALLRVESGGHGLDASLLELVESGRARFEEVFRYAQDKSMFLETRRAREGAKS